VKLVDSHCHLDDKQFAADRDAVIERAQAAGVERLMAIGTATGRPIWKRLSGSPIAIRSSMHVGVHPHDAAKATTQLLPARELLEHPKVLALGNRP